MTSDASTTSHQIYLVALYSLAAAGAAVGFFFGWCAKAHVVRERQAYLARMAR